MSDLASAIILFSLAAILHALSFRVLLRLGIRSFMPAFTFVVGFMIQAYCVFSLHPHILPPKYCSTWGTAMPFSSLLLYFFLSWFYIMLTLGAYLGTLSPSTKIMELLKRNGSMTKEEIIRCFSDRDLVRNRLSELVRDRAVAVSDGRFLATPRGRRLVDWIAFYRHILNWKAGG